MALRNIVLEGDPILTKKCREVTEFDERLHELLNDMAETMKNAKGVGLAAPQVGILKRKNYETESEKMDVAFVCDVFRSIPNPVYFLLS